MSKITLRDIDNRGDNGEPYEFTKGPESVVGYLDGPLRSDLKDPEDNGPRLDEAIALVRAGDVAGANALLNPMGIYLAGAGTAHE